MLIRKPVGITSYGVSLPAWSLETTAIQEAQGKTGASIGQSLGVFSKTVPAADEDAITLAVAAARATLQTAPHPSDQKQIGALFVGSESHPYAVKPSGSIVANLLGLSEELAVADLQFACKAATAGWQIGVSYVLAGLAKQALVIGADTAQSRPGDALEFTAGAGAAAYLFGQKNLLAKLVATLSVATDTPDFWRRAGQSYPEHAGRFSGEPAYFYHIQLAARKILAQTKLMPSDFAYCVFHTPNGKFPKAVAASLGFTPAQLAPSLVVEKIGNTYAAAVPLALSAVLDVAGAGQKILVVSYGSGSGSDAFVFETTGLLPKFNQGRAGKIAAAIALLQKTDYQTYSSVMKLLTH